MHNNICDEVEQYWKAKREILPSLVGQARDILQEIAGEIKNKELAQALVAAHG